MLFNVILSVMLIWPVGQAVKTLASHAENMGSIPVRVTKKSRTPKRCSAFLLSVYEKSRPSPQRLRCGIGFANSTMGHSVLARELLGEFSAESECSQAPSRIFNAYLSVFCFFVSLLFRAYI